MNPDDHVCLCFRVSLRKLVNFARRERPALASQMSGCLGAGTGCGWCVPVLERIQADPDRLDLEKLDPAAYAARRSAYHETLRRGGDRRRFGRPHPSK